MITSGTESKPPEVRCRRCKAVVFVARIHFCGRGKGASGALTTLECPCRGRDDHGLLVIPGPTITADEQRRLGGSIIPVRASEHARDIEGDGKCASEPGCSRNAVAYCDFPLGVDGTCDKRMCRRHRIRIAPDVDRCGAHAEPPWERTSRRSNKPPVEAASKRAPMPPVDSPTLFDSAILGT